MQACVPLYYDEVVRVYPKGTRGLRDERTQCLIAQRGYSSSEVAFSSIGGPIVVTKAVMITQVDVIYVLIVAFNAF